MLVDVVVVVVVVVGCFVWPGPPLQRFRGSSLRFQTLDLPFNDSEGTVYGFKQ